MENLNATQEDYVPNYVFSFFKIQEILHIHIFMIHEFRYLQKWCQDMLSLFTGHVFTALSLGESLKKMSR